MRRFEKIDQRGKLNTNYKHGMTGTRTFRIWIKMRYRCRSEEPRHFNNYKARGIKVCKAWQNSFVLFLHDMGVCPSNKHSIDRIDNNKGYYKENCRWATKKEQSRNRQNTTLLRFNGQVKPLSTWCEILDIPRGTVHTRLRRGYSVNDALDTSHKRRYT